MEPIMQNTKWALSKFANLSQFPRYVRELPSFIRGTAEAKLPWGGTMRVPFPEHRDVATTGYFDGEHEVFDYFNEHITKDDIFFDIGANAGYYSLLAASKGATVYAFEPFPDTFDLLIDNVMFKKNIHPNKMAISNKTGYAKMDGSGVSGYNKISPQGTTDVLTLAIDDFIDQMGLAPTIIKIDVEYHDLEACQGMENLLKTHHPTLMVECDNSMDYLFSLGYTATLLGNPKKRDYLFTFK